MSANATSPNPPTTTSWGLSFTPGVSSSKKRKSPALAAGIGASSRLLFSRLVLKADFSIGSSQVVGNKCGEDFVASLSDVNVGVGVLACFECIVYVLESFPKFSHVICD